MMEDLQTNSGDYLHPADASEDLPEVLQQTQNSQDPEVLIGNCHLPKAEVLSRIKEVLQPQKDSEGGHHTSSSEMSSQICPSATSSMDFAGDYDIDEGLNPTVSTFGATKETSDAFPAIVFEGPFLKPGHFVLIPNAIALSGGCKRLDLLGDTRQYKISWLVSRKYPGPNSEADNVNILPELEVVLKLECTKDSTNLITCRLCDAGDVIKDYLQEANQLAIHADFNVKVLVCQTVMEFEKFQLKEENKAYGFESIPINVMDRFALDFLTSSPEDIKVQVRILDNLETFEKPNPIQETILYNQGPNDKLFSAVFGTELVLDLILQYVVRDEELTSWKRTKDVCAINKAWRESVRRVVNSRSARTLCLCTIERKLKTTPGGFPLGDVLPYNLLVVEHKVVNPLVLKFLHRYPPIGLRYVTSGMLDTNLFETVQKFRLQALKISRIEDNMPISHLQRILSAFPTVKELNITCKIAFPHPDHGPNHLVLPRQLENLYLRTDVSSFQKLAGSDIQVSNLKLFDVQINEFDSDEGSGENDISLQTQLAADLNRLLQNMLPLQYLSIEIEGADETHIILPDFINLKKLEFYGSQLTCHRDVDQLEDLSLNGIQTLGIMEIFIQDRQFKNVTKLELNLGDNLTVNVVDRMADCMSKCVILDIALVINSDSSPVFRRLFTRMHKLTSLRMSLIVEDADYVTPLHMDSYFTGLTLEEVRVIQAQPESWSVFNLASEAIVNLTHLRALELELLWVVNDVPVCMTELLFNLTLFRMPHLVKLTLEGEFLIADELIEQWRSGGRSYKRH